MTTQGKQYDAIVIGGGPAGATAATLLARGGLDVAVLEKESFPRFHIGESLLPATVNIFERLGVHEQIKSKYIKKPGGKWYYGPDPVKGDFSQSDGKASFKAHPYSYLVERSSFDKILLDNAQTAGAEIYEQHEVTDLIHEGPRLAGVRTRDGDGQSKEFHGKMVFDCSGLGAVLGKKLKTIKENSLRRIGIHAQYKARPLEADAKAGWFVGRMIDDGWVWLIPLEDDLISVGVVVGVEEFKKVESAPDAYIDRMVATNPLFTEGLTPNPERVSEVRTTGRMGQTNDRLAGEGWVLVGDAAFFIDPCYSSGVHMAMETAEKAADIYLKGHAAGDYTPAQFREYETSLKKHEKTVLQMVNAFYIATKSRLIQKAVYYAQNPFSTAKFVTFVGGDFSKNRWFISYLYHMTRLMNFLFGRRRAKAS